MKNLLKHFKMGIVVGLGMVFTLTVSGMVYAAWLNIDTASNGSILTSTSWNNLLTNVESLKDGTQIPEGLISAFGTTTCPSGWKAADGTNNTPDLRGMFIRGANNFGTGIRTDEYRDVDRANAGSGVLSKQGDAIRNITGGLGRIQFTSIENQRGALSSTHQGSGWGAGTAGQFNSIYFDASGSVPTGSDNRPQNIALIYCMKE